MKLVFVRSCLRARRALDARDREGIWRRARKTAAMTTAALLGWGLVPVMAPAGLVAHAAPVGQGFNINPSDLQFILKQIEISERHVATATASNPCGTLRGDGPDQIPTGPQGEELPWGLRTVDGTCNNLVPGQEKFGAADQVFPRRTRADFRDAEAAPPGIPSNATTTGGTSSYARSGSVTDSHPRVVSNLVVDQTAGNPAAVAAAGPEATPDESGSLSIPNTAPDVGLSAPFNSWFTLFGQFFDHGLDLVNKGGGAVYIPLKDDDPLVAGDDGVFDTEDDLPPEQRFMVLTRSTNSPGSGTNQTATFVDQSQTYASHPAHQVFLREYARNIAGEPVSTGRMLEGSLNIAGRPEGGMATWEDVKEQARSLLGIELSDQDALNVPLLATDQYGRFLPGPLHGMPQLVMADGTRIEGNPNPSEAVSTVGAVRTGQAFLNDIAHHAVPFGDHDRDPRTPRQPLSRDADDVATVNDGLAGTYDDELLDEHFVAGDGRVNENLGLISMHHVFHAEHNRLAGDSTVPGSVRHVLVNEASPSLLAEYQLSPGVWNGERIFQAAKFVTEMEYQHLAFEEFARKVQPMINAFGEGGGGYDTEVNPAIKAEFAHAVYRFGHSMLTETVARRNADGTKDNIRLLDAFLNPLAFDDAGTMSPEQAAGSIVRGMTRQTGSEIDEFVTEALRNNLLGLPLDLAAINIARARETGVPRLNDARRQFYAESNNSALAPYTSWSDFGFSLKHPESLVNFVAAYGTHDTITGSLAQRRAAAARIVANDSSDPATPSDSADFMTSSGSWAGLPSGLEDVDLWVGGLAEKRMVFGGLLGSTFNYVFEMQMEDLQFGDRFYYLSRTAGLNLLTQLEGNSFAELIMRNTDMEGLPADVFSRPDYIFNVGRLGTTGAIPDDPTTEDYDEGKRTSEPGMHLTRMPDATLRYTGPAHTVFNGTARADRMWASEGDDTIRGNDGNDWMQGGDGVDSLIGGLGNDIINDLFGDDTLKGGDGNDALSAGQGFGGDLNQGGRGRDFIIGGNDMTETFAGPGNDFVYAGDGEDTVFGDDGDDWIEGGKGPFNLLQGDFGNPFQDDPSGGHDVLDGNGGEQDFDSEGGDDIQLAGPGIQRAEGMLGFDWFAHKGDPRPADTDMLFTALTRPSIDALRDRTDLTEGLSGWEQDDVLRGDDRVAADLEEPGDGGIARGHRLTTAGINRIPGLAGILPAGTRAFDSGNIIIGGAGSDLLEGRGGDDIINGDAWLDVQLRAPDHATADTTDTRLVDSLRQLEADVFARRTNPGAIAIVRTIKTAANGTAVDTAEFNDVRTAYTCTVDAVPVEQCPTAPEGSQTIVVSHNGGNGVDGTDTVRNVERLDFAEPAGATAPAAPVIGTAVAGNGRATVNFTPPPDDGGSAILEYEVDVLTDGVVVRTVRGIANSATSTVVTGLTNGTRYRFRVRAVNAVAAGASSALSNRVSPATVPGSPLIGTASPGAVGGLLTATARWSPPADDGGRRVTGYVVTALRMSPNDTVLERTRSPVLAADARSRVFTLTAGSYRFVVAARNIVGQGEPSAPSNLVNAR